MPLRFVECFLHQIENLSSLADATNRVKVRISRVFTSDSNFVLELLELST